MRLGESAGRDDASVTVVGPSAFIKTLPRFLCGVWKRKGYCSRSYVKSMCSKVCRKTDQKAGSASKKESSNTLVHSSESSSDTPLSL